MWAPPLGQIESVRTTRRSIPASRSRGGERWGRVQARRRGTSLMSTMSNWKLRYSISWKTKAKSVVFESFILLKLFIVQMNLYTKFYVDSKFPGWLYIDLSLRKILTQNIKKRCLWKQTNFTYFHREYCTCIKICTENLSYMDSDSKSRV